MAVRDTFGLSSLDHPPAFPFGCFKDLRSASISPTRHSQFKLQRNFDDDPMATSPQAFSYLKFMSSLFVFPTTIGSSTNNAAQIAFCDSLKRRSMVGRALEKLDALLMNLDCPSGATTRGIMLTFGTLQVSNAVQATFLTPRLLRSQG